MLRTAFTDGKTLVGVFTIALSALFLFDSRSLEFGSLTEIGPGFFPRVVAIAGLIVGLLAILESFSDRVKRNRADLTDPEDVRRMTKNEIQRLTLVFAGLFAYCILLAIAGFIVANLVITFFLMLLMRKGKYVPALIASGLSTIALWLIFEHLLQMPLPQGVFWA